MLTTLPIMALLVQAPVLGGPTGEDLAAAAHAAFAAKCVQCHGEELKHPTASFGFVTDLRRLAASPDFVVPGKPEESEVWKQISGGDMPPDGAREGPLTADQKAAILAWIQAGAPAPGGTPTARESDRAETLGPAEPPAARDAAAAVRPRARDLDDQADPSLLVRRVVEFAGRFHVVVIHFPIALLMAAGIAEAWGALRKGAVLPIVRFCLGLGAVSAVIAAALGWAHALDGFPGPLANPLTISGLHRWLGTAVAAVATITLALSERDARHGVRRPLSRAAVFVLAAMVGAAGHFGGLLTHGQDYFSLPARGASASHVEPATEVGP